MRQDVIEAIRRAAIEHGVDPNYALAVAQRESSFDPNAHSSKSIYGIFQMTGGLRQKWGAGDSSDPYTQASAFMRYLNGEVRPQMYSVLGRAPTDAEAYLGHHFGPTRAARMISQYDPNTPVDEIFTPYERSINPHFDRAGTSGNLMASITNDIGRRQQRFGGEGSGAGGGTQTAALDFSKFGTLADSSEGRGGGGLDFSHLGIPVDGDRKSEGEAPQRYGFVGGVGEQQPYSESMASPHSSDFYKRLEGRGSGNVEDRRHRQGAPPASTDVRAPEEDPDFPGLSLHEMIRRDDVMGWIPSEADPYEPPANNLGTGLSSDLGFWDVGKPQAEP